MSRRMHREYASTRLSAQRSLMATQLLGDALRHHLLVYSENKTEPSQLHLT
ncbi:hypothetical protein [Sphingobacterium paludis]|uniref:hypothetical protein n=1 Tax=Sphingobacterium paludis TaxID=1476465 RepID=UPI001414EDF8|nr:hypothetical protein [Sphingobacterium paludis]